MEQLGEEEQTKAGGAQRVENQGILRFMTQRAGQAWGQVCPPLWASAFCLGPRVQALPVRTDSQQPHPGVQCWLNTLWQRGGGGWGGPWADRWEGD